MSGRDIIPVAVAGIDRRCCMDVAFVLGICIVAAALGAGIYACFISGKNDDNLNGWR